MNTKKWWLESGEARADQYGSFEIPPYEARSQLRKGMYVKAIFAFEDGSRERMWIEVIDGDANGYKGSLLSNPVTVDEHILTSGAPVSFEPRHIIDIDDPEES